MPACKAKTGRFDTRRIGREQNAAEFGGDVIAPGRACAGKTKLPPEAATVKSTLTRTP
jgi:hypothetical protein